MASEPALTHMSLLPQSSPMKNVKPAPHRVNYQNSPAVQNTDISDTFLTNHLSPVPEDLDWREHADVSLLPQSKKNNPDHLEKKYYRPFATFLNALSGFIKEYVQSSTGKHLKPIEFIPNFGNVMTHHPAGADRSTNSNYAPDLIGVEGPLDENFVRLPTQKTSRRAGPTAPTAPAARNDPPPFKLVPYPLARTVIEMKRDDDDGLFQSLSYPGYVFEASPHLVGLYVVSAKPQYYQLAWVDASGSVASNRLSWDNLQPLVSYLYSLYVPPPHHILLDRTIEPHAPGKLHAIRLLDGESKKDVGPSVEWRIMACDEFYDPCTIIVWSSGQGRRTTVFEKLEADENRIVIKDAYRDNARRFKEADLLRHIHADGIFPGVARLLGSEDVRDPVTEERVGTCGLPTSTGKVVQRYKTRLVLGSYGERLQRARKLSDVVKAIYDAVEVHRGLVMERKILHRDMSVNNILIYPTHHPLVRGNGLKFFKPQQPIRFIDQVLGPHGLPGRDGLSDTTEDHSRCLLIDFDNSSPADQALAKTLISEEYTPSEAVRPSTSAGHIFTHELAARTGTPKFIARSVSQGITLPSKGPFVQFLRMPELSGDAKDKYVAAYGEETYQQWTDAPNHYHGREPPTTPYPTNVSFTHRPCHDVESIFWTFLYTLVKLRPLGAADEQYSELGAGIRLMKEFLLGHHIPGDSKGYSFDVRECILDTAQYLLEDALHPGLRNIGLDDLLFRMAKQVKPEYALLRPYPPLDHLHEAFRRLLLEFIVALQETPANDIELDSEHERNLYPPENPNVTGKGKASKKRSAPYEDGYYSTQSGKRTCTGTRNVSAPPPSHNGAFATPSDEA